MNCVTANTGGKGKEGSKCGWGCARPASFVGNRESQVFCSRLVWRNTSDGQARKDHHRNPQPRLGNACMGSAFSKLVGKKMNYNLLKKWQTMLLTFVCNLNVHRDRRMSVAHDLRGGRGETRATRQTIEVGSFDGGRRYS